MENNWDVVDLLYDFKNRAYQENDTREYVKLLRLTLEVWKAHFKL